MKKKTIFLFLALILPGLVFVFLKRFGKNEFAIPVFYQHSADSLNAACGTHYGQPYHVPDSMLLKSGWQNGRPALFVVDSTVRGNSEFSRLGDSFEASAFQVINVTPPKINEATYSRWCSCVLMVKAPFNVVLMDSERRIRGYYRIGSREETDRLIVELQILLKKF